MKCVPQIFLFLAAFLLSIYATSIAGQFKVTRVYDGDTIKAKGHEIEIKVRLVGIDAPETSKKKKTTWAAIQSKGEKISRWVDIGQDR